MRLPASLATLLSVTAMLIAMAGCGTTTRNPGTPVVPPTPLDLTGNWQMQTAPAPVTNPLAPSDGRTLELFYGVLSQVGGDVTGIGRVTLVAGGNACTVTEQVKLSGTLDSTNHLALTTTTTNGSTVQISLALSSDLHSSASGTITVTGACAMPSSAATGVQFAPLTGTYTGNLQALDVLSQVSTGPVGVTTATLTQGAANPDGTLPVGGTIKVVFPSCSVTLAVTGTTTGVLTSFVPPPTFGGGPPPPRIFFEAGEFPDGTKLTLFSTSLDPACGVTTGSKLQGLLTRQ